MVKIAVHVLTGALLVAPGLAGAPIAAMAQSAPSGEVSQPRIAVLDLDKVRNEAAAGQSIRKQFDAYRKALQKEAEEEQKKLRAARDKLRMQQSLLAPEAMREQERKFKAQLAETQRRFEGRKQALEKSYAEALKVFDENLKSVLEGLIKEMKLDLIVNKRMAAVYTDPNLEITDETLKRLDARIKKVTVKKPQN